MDANEVRHAFSRFFEERGHTTVPSASLIPHDPTVLFTIAGMVPFKPYFLGEEQPPHARMTTIQKCFRANDIELIGTTDRHCTFFEMLGNFSFGDYFKEGAIRYAWDLVTEVFGLDGDRIWVTVHESDEDAAAIWADTIGLPAARIQRLGEDNFWAMGDTGPRGTDSELFFDKGPEYGPDGGPANEVDTSGSWSSGTSSSWQQNRTEDGVDRGPAAQEHRHRRGPRPLRGDPQRQGLDLRDRPVRRAARRRPVAHRPHLRQGPRHRRGAAPHRGPRPRHDDARGRRRAAHQRGARLRAAAHRASRAARRASPRARRRSR